MSKSPPNTHNRKKKLKREDPLERLEGEKRDKKAGRGREQRDLRIKGYGKKGENGLEEVDDG